MAANIIDQETLKSILDYDPLTGIFIWKKSASKAVRNGSIAGTKDADGYIVIRINKKNYLAHRLSFLYMNGAFPSGYSDHIDHVRDNNIFSNLRDVPKSSNDRNCRMNKRNTSGVNGVARRGSSNGWTAYITYEKKRMHIGIYKTLEEASAAREAYNKLFGFHKNHGLSASSVSLKQQEPETVESKS